jgi:regulator of replication initiation timing
LNKIKELEVKLLEYQKGPKPTSQVEDASKIKTAQLDASVKKLTQDLNESRNLLSEMKKENNKIRQEKNGLQNQLDKIKKDMERSKKSGGKAA